jgi:choline-glycine betaine transporter
MLDQPSFFEDPIQVSTNFITNGSIIPYVASTIIVLGLISRVKESKFPKKKLGVADNTPSYLIAIGVFMFFSWLIWEYFFAVPTFC